MVWRLAAAQGGIVACALLLGCGERINPLIGNVSEETFAQAITASQISQPCATTWIKGETSQPLGECKAQAERLAAMLNQGAFSGITANDVIEESLWDRHVASQYYEDKTPARAMELLNKLDATVSKER